MSYSLAQKPDRVATATQKNAKQTRARQWANGLLSPKEKATINIAAQEAYAIQSEVGLTDSLSLKDWRHEQTAIATAGKTSSLREATHQQFCVIYAWFLRLAGKEAEAKKVFSRTGRAKGSDEVHDTLDNRRTATFLVNDLLKKSNGIINDAYVEKIISNKYNKPFSELTASELQQLFYTLKNRLTKKK